MNNEQGISNNEVEEFLLLNKATAKNPAFTSTFIIPCSIFDIKNDRRRK